MSENKPVRVGGITQNNMALTKVTYPTLNTSFDSAVVASVGRNLS